MEEFLERPAIAGFPVSPALRLTRPAGPGDEEQFRSQVAPEFVVERRPDLREGPGGVDPPVEQREEIDLSRGGGHGTPFLAPLQEHAGLIGDGLGQPQGKFSGAGESAPFLQHQGAQDGLAAGQRQHQQVLGRGAGRIA